MLWEQHCPCHPWVPAGMVMGMPRPGAAGPGGLGEVSQVSRCPGVLGAAAAGSDPPIAQP